VTIFRIAGNGQVYYQGGVLRTTCNDSSAISYIKNLVNAASRKYRQPSATTATHLHFFIADVKKTPVSPT
jgi:methenyltetrahydromethanopterin cyclohydrolase